MLMLEGKDDICTRYASHDERLAAGRVDRASNMLMGKCGQADRSTSYHDLLHRLVLDKDWAFDDDASTHENGRR